MNAYTNFTNHLTEHAYRRGANKGDAPLYENRRHKSNCRALTAYKLIDGQSVECMVVRMFATDIMVVSPDGRVRINLGGWSTSPTTREAINEALSIAYKHLPHLRVRIHSLTKFGHSDTVLSFTSVVSGVVKRKSYRYYPNMTIDSDGTLTTDPSPFLARRIDREASADITRALKASGFMDMLPVLWETAQPPEPPGYTFLTCQQTLQILSDPEQADRWPGIVHTHKHYGRTTLSLQATKTRLLAYLRVPLHRLIDTDITCIVTPYI
jgi:hypothetical protein